MAEDRLGVVGPHDEPDRSVTGTQLNMGGGVEGYQGRCP